LIPEDTTIYRDIVTLLVSNLIIVTVYFYIAQHYMQHVDISNFVNDREASCADVKGKQNSPISFPVLIL